MPHFIIDCSENILESTAPELIMQAVYETAEATGLFAQGDIKVRINPFKYYQLGETKQAFIHVFANIMEGRHIDQKSNLSERVVRRLKAMLPDVPIISMNIRDFERATYCNRSMI